MRTTPGARRVCTVYNEGGHMDVEKTVEFLLGMQARFDQSMAKLTSYQIEAEARHTKEMAEMRAEHVKGMAAHASDMADLRAELRRAEHMAVVEFRRERHRRLELYEDLSRAQKVTEEKLQRLIDSLHPKQ